MGGHDIAAGLGNIYSYREEGMKLLLVSKKFVRKCVCKYLLITQTS